VVLVGLLFVVVVVGGGGGGVLVVGGVFAAHAVVNVIVFVVVSKNKQIALIRILVGFHVRCILLVLPPFVVQSRTLSFALSFTFVRLPVAVANWWGGGCRRHQAARPRVAPRRV
jgi:hypothetical protein